MSNDRDNTTETSSSAWKREKHAQHEVMIVPFQGCKEASYDHDPESDSCYSANPEMSCLLSPPPSQTPTVTGSLSDQSFDSEHIKSANVHIAKNVPTSVEEPQEQSFMCESSLGSEVEVTDDILECDNEQGDKGASFLLFRMSYLFVTLVVMLADGLQGTTLPGK
jgi:hypothetical protein